MFLTSPAGTTKRCSVHGCSDISGFPLMNSMKPSTQRTPELSKRAQREVSRPFALVKPLRSFRFCHGPRAVAVGRHGRQAAAQGTLLRPAEALLAAAAWLRGPRLRQQLHRLLGVFVATAVRQLPELLKASLPQGLGHLVPREALRVFEALDDLLRRLANELGGATVVTSSRVEASCQTIGASLCDSKVCMKRSQRICDDIQRNVYIQDSCSQK